MLGDDRLIVARGPTPPPAELEALLMGSCPGVHDAGVLLADPSACHELARLGFADELRALERVVADGAQRSGRLDGLPIPVQSYAHFSALFPEALTLPTAYVSALAGNRAWLPRAVEDYFAADGPRERRRLWVLVVPESSTGDGGRRAFLPTPGANLLAPGELAAFNRALLIPSLGVIGLPDLERLQIPARLPDLSRKHFDNPAPVFLPCAGADEVELDAAERRSTEEMASARQTAPLELAEIVAPIVRVLAETRPDVQVLLTLPPSYAAQNLVSLDREALAYLKEQRSRGTPGLERIQFLFPYLRAPDADVRSPAGVLAGAIVAMAERAGPWRSIAGHPLLDRLLVFPLVEHQEVLALRADPGIGVLVNRSRGVELDDERLVCPVVGVGDDSGRPTEAALAVRSALRDDLRCGELARFLGAVRRALLRLGEALAFDFDPRDPRPRIALEAYFEGLHARGALRGRDRATSFSIAQIPAPESTAVYHIEVAPALPIDRMSINVSHSGAPPGFTLEVGRA